MKLEGKHYRYVEEAQSKAISEIHDELTRENGSLRLNKESPVRHAPGSAPILAKFNVKPTGVGV